MLLIDGGIILAIVFIGLALVGLALIALIWVEIYNRGIEAAEQKVWDRERADWSRHVAEMNRKQAQ